MNDRIEQDPGYGLDMTKRELIEALRDFPDDMDLIVYSTLDDDKTINGYYGPLVVVELASDRIKLGFMNPYKC